MRVTMTSSIAVCSAPIKAALSQLIAATVTSMRAHNASIDSEPGSW